MVQNIKMNKQNAILNETKTWKSPQNDVKHSFIADKNNDVKYLQVGSGFLSKYIFNIFEGKKQQPKLGYFDFGIMFVGIIQIEYTFFKYLQYTYQQFIELKICFADYAIFCQYSSKSSPLLLIIKVYLLICKPKTAASATGNGMYILSDGKRRYTNS